MNKDQCILILTPYYIPGYKGGGPIRSIFNLVSSLKDSYKFKIITTDRDLGDNNSYSNIMVNEWNNVDGIDVFYGNQEYFNIRNMRKLLLETSYDLIYLNSYFSFKFSIAPMLLSKLNLIKNIPILIAPRGEFSPGALNIKKNKKQLFLKVSKFIRLHQKVVWQATSVMEKEDIKREYANNTVVVAQNISARTRDYPYYRKKEKYSLKVIFISRISEKKNLDGALEILKHVTFPMVFNIFGPIEDSDYWEMCKKLIRELPTNIEVNYNGELNNNEVGKAFSQHDLFLFPTNGENYGHVIVESLLAGCPVLISDKTPWVNLESKDVGWDIPLKDVSKYAKVLSNVYEFDSKDMVNKREKIRDFINKQISEQNVINAYKDIFNKIIK